jgi:RIO kinase 1
VCYEESSVADPLEVLLADGVIDEILGRLKSGKEANITLVRHKGEIIAAKVYKDRATRSFKNNADYKEGRKVRNSRTARAMEGGGKFGREAAEQEWKSAESQALSKLVSYGGVRVPKPVMFYEGVLLMELVTDAEGQPAPRLIDVSLDPSAAARIYADLRSQIIAMLCCDLIHGDLSPYNILAAAAGPTIIDFPQVVSAVHSSRAEFFFHRDFDNVLRYVSTFDRNLEKQTGDGRAIWRAYVARDLTPDYVPPPPQARRPGPPRRDFRGPPRNDRRPPDPRNGSRDARPPDPRNGSRDARPPDPRNGPRGPDTRPPDPRNGSREARPPDPPNGSRGPDTRPSQPPRGRSRGPRQDSRTPPPAPDPSTLRKVPPSALRPDLRLDSRPATPARRGPPGPQPAGGHRRRPKRHW